jgi:hypothetical protein
MLLPSPVSLKVFQGRIGSAASEACELLPTDSLMAPQHSGTRELGVALGARQELRGVDFHVVLLQALEKREMAIL